MKTEPDKKNKADTRTAVKVKANKLDALNELGDLLGLLIALHKNGVEKASLSDDPASIHMQRLSFYDRLMPSLIACFEKLEAALSTKQPGGAPRNRCRDIAFEILVQHYEAEQEVLRPKMLVKFVEAKLPESERYGDANSKEPFPLSTARNEVSMFKALLRTSADDWN
jgi:hypothetical protein